MEFMLAFMVPPRAPAPAPERLAEMKAFSAELASQRALRRGAPLERARAAVRVRIRESGAIVSDGPFAESKEVIGGWAILRTDSKAEVIRIATEFMELHRKHWHGFEGESEVRPMEEF